MLTFITTNIIEAKEVNETFLSIPLICSSIYNRPFEANYIIDLLKDTPQVTGILLKNCTSFLLDINQVINDIKKVDPNIKICFETNSPNLSNLTKYLASFDYIKINTSKGRFLFYQVLHHPECTGNLEPLHRPSDITYKFKQ